MNVKVAIIAGMLVGLAVFDVMIALGKMPAHFPGARPWNLHALRSLLGSLIVVQGFETSRFLGGAYSAKQRIRTMRYAQWLSGGIYVAFLALILPLAGFLHRHEETAVIDLTAHVTPLLPWLLIIAAVMSQFSAATADTLGGGGLIVEATRRWIDSRRAYALIALVVTWLTDVFQVISFASRAFAFYYALQAFEAAWLAATNPLLSYRIWRGIAFALLAFLMLAVTVFGIPSD